MKKLAEYRDSMGGS